MEVGVHHGADTNHNHNMSNGHGPAGGIVHHNKHHTQHDGPKTSTGQRNFHSPSRVVHKMDRNNKAQAPNDEALRVQTKKVMEVFFQNIVATNGTAERIRRESRERFEQQNALPESRVGPSGGRSHRSLRPTRVRPRQESDDEKLYKVMSGQMRQPRRHQSDISLVSSDSADSAMKGTLQRTKSFTKAQRHSIVSELEKRAEKQTLSRRSSENFPQTSALYLEPGSLQNSYGGSQIEKEADSPVSHTRASSDPVIAKYDTTGRYKSQNKDKEKKSWLKGKFFKKKKDGHKLKDDSRDSATSGEAAAAYSTQGSKVVKSHSDRRTIAREDSTVSRRSPSPPGSPKRTPKLLRRFSSRNKKTSKCDSSSSSQRDSSKTTGRSKSVDIIEEDDVDGTNGDSKSNSLPKEARLSTKLPHHGHKKHEPKHKEEKHHGSAVAVDGVSDHVAKGGKKTLRDSYDVQRPDTLDLPKKKSSNWKKFKKIIFDSSSSSSSSESPCSSVEDLNKPPQKGMGSRESESSTQKAESSQKSTRSIRHSNSDNQPSHESVRGRYLHRQSKSMSDADLQDKSLTAFANKLRRVADGYSHIFAQQYCGPAGRTHTPDSYRQEMSRNNGDATPVKRTTSHTTPSGGVPSHSMKAYLNMTGASRPRGSGETGNRRPRQRITRDEIHHRPSGSFDSPHRHDVTRSWSDRIDTERLVRSEVHFDSHPRKESPVNRRLGAASHLPSSEKSPIFPRGGENLPPAPASRLSPPLAHHRNRTTDSRPLRSPGNSPRAPPAPTTSTSPKLRSSRLGRIPTSQQSSSVVADSPSANHHYHLERHVDRTITAHAPRHTRTVHTHRDIVDDVEADSLPFVMTDDDSTDVDMAIAFADDDVTEVTEEKTETITVTEEIDSYPIGAAPVGRQRSVTSPPRISEDELGAVGGVDPNIMDEDKLVDKLVEALCKKGDQISNDLDTPQIEEGLSKMVSQLSRETVKSAVERALAKVKETASTFRHPEIIQLALIFDMAGLFRRMTTSQSFLSGLLNPFIEPILKQFGGWTTMLQSSLDETEQEIFDQEDPTTSKEKRHDKHRRGSDTDDGELD